MLGFVRRSSTAIPNPRMQTALYKTLVKSQIVHFSQIWSPQSVKIITDIEIVQRRATKFILSLPFQTNVTYKDGLLMTGLLPLPDRLTRRNECSEQITLNLPTGKHFNFSKQFLLWSSKNF